MIVAHLAPFAGNVAIAVVPKPGEWTLPTEAGPGRKGYGGAWAAAFNQAELTPFAPRAALKSRLSGPGLRSYVAAVRRIV
jgi:hypothetical protein